MRPTRRRFGSALGGLAAAAIAFPTPLRGQAKARVVVIGGGAAGATCARYLAQNGKGELAVTLVEEQPRYTTCFYSNLYLAGWRDLASLNHGYAGLQAAGVELVLARAVAADPAGRTVRLASGETLAYDRLVVAPGIDLRYDSIAGYSEAAARSHAAQLEGRCSDEVVARPARGDARWRPVRDCGAARALSLPARTL